MTVSSSTTESTLTDSDGEFISSVEINLDLGLGLGVQGFLELNIFFQSLLLVLNTLYRVGFDLQGKNLKPHNPIWDYDSVTMTMVKVVRLVM